MLKITSRDNPRLKLAKKVRDGNIENLIFVEGTRLAEEVLKTGLKITDVLYTENFAKTERGQALLHQLGPNIAEVNPNVFDSVSGTKNSPGIIVLCRQPDTGQKLLDANLSLKNPSLVVLLHRINNPSNLGAILRTCEAANVTGVIITKNSADVFSPKALRGAMGASLRIPIWKDADFYSVLDWSKKQDLISICADVNAQKSYLEIDWKKSRLLIFGSEAQGLDADERRKIDESLLIPMENKVESLNLAVACGIVLFEARRQSKL